MIAMVKGGGMRGVGDEGAGVVLRDSEGGGRGKVV